MKKVFYTLLVVSTAVFVSCNKENVEDPSGVVVDITPKKTITFSASIEMPSATKAALSGLDINWQSGDYIGIAADNSSDIVAYPITVDGEDPTKCTFTVDAVPGATAYYAIFRGSNATIDKNDFTGVAFDTDTKTFSGLTVGKQQVSAGEFNSHLYITNGYPLSMAGKSNGTSLVMKPCLALFKLQIAAGSVPSDYYFTETYTSSKSVNHDHNYSAVRGFNLYQKGSSTILSSGDFTVQVAADGSLTTTAVDNENKGEYRQLSQSEKLVSGTDYLMCLIPGGSITSVVVDFLGYKDNTPTLSWDAVYTMRKTGNLNVTPGSFVNLGTLNPIALKKTQNEANDEAIDAAAQSYTPAITIDGDMSDWASLSASQYVGISAPSQDYQELKVAYDALMLYFYSKRNSARISEWGKGYIWYRIDTNSDTSAYEKAFYFYPYSISGSGPYVVSFNSAPASSNISSLTLSVAGHQDTESGIVEIEVSVPRSELNISNGAVLNFQSEANKVNTGAQLTPASSLTISD